MQIHIRQSKNLKDRYSILSEKLLILLRQYFKQFRPKDYLFPGIISGQPLSIRNIQDTLKKAKDNTGITKNVSVHSLRHSFATHLLESKTDIRSIQELLGHERLETTAKHLHLTRKSLMGIKSPLDNPEVD